MEHWPILLDPTPPLELGALILNAISIGTPPNLQTPAMKSFPHIRIDVTPPLIFCEYHTLTEDSLAMELRDNIQGINIP